MAFPVVSGHPNYSTTGNEAIPIIYAMKRIKNFYDVSVMPVIANTDYEKEIANKGDEVVIRGEPNATIRDYVEGARLIRERLPVPSQSLLIDKGQYFNFTLGDVMRAQMDAPYKDDWLTAANQGMKLKIDNVVLGGLEASVAAINKGMNAGRETGKFNLGASGANAVQLTAANSTQFITRCGSVLDEANVPDTDRWMLISAPARAVIQASDLKNASITGDMQSTLRNGRLGMIDRFTLYHTNLLPKSGTGDDQEYRILFGHKYANTFASQIVKTETLRIEDTFGDLWRGLQVWGWKTVKPEAIGVGIVKVAAAAI